MTQPTHNPHPSEYETEYSLARDIIEKQLSYRQKELYDSLIHAGCLWEFAYRTATIYEE